jgi:hypothetical protein
MWSQLTGCGLAVLMLFAVWPPADAQNPDLIILSPSNGAVIAGTSVTVTFQTPGFTMVPSAVPASEAARHPELNRPNQGHIHMMLDLQPLDIS